MHRESIKRIGGGSNPTQRVIKLKYTTHTQRPIVSHYNADDPFHRCKYGVSDETMRNCKLPKSAGIIAIIMRSGAGGNERDSECTLRFAASNNCKSNINNLWTEHYAGAPKIILYEGVGIESHNWI